jgi:dolichol-phosphate mannosyltransferase
MLATRNGRRLSGLTRTETTPRPARPIRLGFAAIQCAILCRPVQLGLAVVIPTLNEAGNVAPLIEKLRRTLDGIEWEAIFVDDDSADGTASILREIGRGDRRIRVLQRIGRHGLASACIEGMLAAAAPYIAIIDADMQHDESILPTMYERIQAQHLDLVVATRDPDWLGAGELPKRRVLLSRFGSRLSRIVSRCGLSDPMSGFFIVDRNLFEEVAHRLSGVGFKILLDIVASVRRPIRFAEVPYRFRPRLLGKSKLEINVGLEYLQLLLDKATGHVVPVRFIMFGLVGGIGIVVHLAALTLLYRLTRMGFVYSQACATLVAMTFNYSANNVTTFRDRRLRGVAIVGGLLIFYLACSAGAIVNLGFATFLLAAGLPWYFAGIPGAAVSSLWNYGVNSVLTWRRSIRAMERRPPAD